MLDSNHVKARIAELPAFMNRLRMRPEDRNYLKVSAVTIAELELGDLITTTTEPDKRLIHQGFVISHLHPYVLEVTRHTASNYAAIMARIKKKYPSHDSHTQAGLAKNGVGINDAWIVASAWEHNLILLTTDKMTEIREAVEDDVEFDNWGA
jgi:predicted nucleic acid-binding protein